MYANRYHSTASRPAGAGGAFLISGAMILGLYYAGPTIIPDGFVEPPIVITEIPIDKPVEPEPKPEDPSPPVASPPIYRPVPPVPLPPTGPDIGTTTTDPGPTPMDPPGPAGPVSGSGGTGTVVEPRPPVMVAPSLDPRYADALQPPYPPAEIRRGTEGLVTARVLIGADGRVKAIDIVKSPSDGLSEATRKQALARWRFKPATRDGVPVEGWKTMTLRFQIVE